MLLADAAAVRKVSFGNPFWAKPKFGLKLLRVGAGWAVKSVFTQEYEIFMHALISARKNAGLTQHELAQRIGKPQSFVSKYERRERRLDLVEFVMITQVLGLDPCVVVKQIERRLSGLPVERAG